MEREFHDWCKKARKHNRFVTDRHDMTLDVKMAFSSDMNKQTLEGYKFLAPLAVDQQAYVMALKLLSGF